MRVTLMLPQPVTRPQFTSESSSITASEITKTFLLVLTDFFVVSIIFSLLIQNFALRTVPFSLCSGLLWQDIIIFSGRWEELEHHWHFALPKWKVCQREW